jgi:hypothetical protein
VDRPGRGGSGRPGLGLLGCAAPDPDGPGRRQGGSVRFDPTLSGPDASEAAGSRSPGAQITPGPDDLRAPTRKSRPSARIDARPSDLRARARRKRRAFRFRRACPVTVARVRIEPAAGPGSEHDSTAGIEPGPALRVSWRRTAGSRRAATRGRRAAPGELRSGAPRDRPGGAPASCPGAPRSIPSTSSAGGTRGRGRAPGPASPGWLGGKRTLPLPA